VIKVCHTLIDYKSLVKLLLRQEACEGIYLIEVFKMFKGFDKNDNIALNDFFKLSSTTLRGHTLKIYKPQIWMFGNFFHS